MEHYFDWITVVSTLASIVSAVASAKSASAAKMSANIADKAIHRTAIREMLLNCHELIAEELRIQSLVNDLKTEYTMLASFTNSLGGSRHQIYINSFDKESAAAANITKTAKRLIENKAGLLDSDDIRLDEMTVEIEGDRIKLKIIRESMSRTLEDIRSQNQLYRDRRVK